MRYIIEGGHVETLAGLWDELDRVMLHGIEWGHNLDAFNDVLRGGFGTPPEGFELIWRNHDLSRQKLGNEQFATVLEIIGNHTGDEQERGHRVVLRLE